MTKHEKRMEMERKVVRHLVRTMKKHGWQALLVDDGGDAFVKCQTERDVMEAVFSVDEAQICFKKGKDFHWVKIILGNDGFDAIADYTFYEDDRDGFDALMKSEVDPYCDKLEERAT